MHIVIFVYRATSLSATVDLRARTREKAWLKSTFQLYRCLIILSDGFNDILATVNIVLRVNTIAFIIMLVYGAVRMEGILALASGLWASNSFVGYGVLVHSYAGAGINEASKAWLEYLK